MKKYTCLFLLLFLIAHFGYSQYHIDESNDAIYLPPETRSLECSGNSTAYLNKYSTIPYYEYSDTDPIKKVIINFVIFQKDDGTDNYQNIAPDLGDNNPSDKYGIDRLMGFIDNLNSRYLNNDPSNPVSGVVDLEDSRFKFVLNNIYFYKDTSGYSTNNLSALTTIIGNQTPDEVYNVGNYNSNISDLEEINVFFTESTGSSNAYVSAVGDLGIDLCCAICRSYRDHLSNPTIGDYATGGGIAHELAHNLGVCHTYLGGGCGTAIASMNSQESWFIDIFGGPYPGNAPHITSIAPYPDCPPLTVQWDADPWDNSYTYSDRVTNNIMGNQVSSRRYMSPSQYAKVNREAYLGPLRKYILDDCYLSNSPIVVNTDEIWDFNIRIYQDLIIDNNSECNIKCHLELPYQAKIVVKSGSSLIVEGSITGVNESNWNGQIEVEPGGELILNDGAELKFGDGGNILIDQSGSLAGNLVYNENALIILEESTSFLEIKGQLHIGTNTTFTFTGAGYIKFSNPGGDSNNNIFCGSGASIVLQGSGQNDKIMEVQQSRCAINRIPTLLHS